jgi:hypothetical protein
MKKKETVIFIDCKKSKLIEKTWEYEKETDSDIYRL